MRYMAFLQEEGDDVLEWHGDFQSAKGAAELVRGKMALGIKDPRYPSYDYGEVEDEDGFIVTAFEKRGNRVHKIPFEELNRPTIYVRGTS